jgi:hypothetical protein
MFNKSLDVMYDKHQSPPSTVNCHTEGKYPPLEQVTRSHLSTEETAHYLNRKQQTLRAWAVSGQVLQPVRINGRLAWPVAEIRRLLGA